MPTMNVNTLWNMAEKNEVLKCRIGQHVTPRTTTNTNNIIILHQHHILIINTLRLIIIKGGKGWRVEVGYLSLSFFLFLSFYADCHSGRGILFYPCPKKPVINRNLFFRVLMS